MKKKAKFFLPVFILGTIISGYVMFVAGKEAYRGRKIDQEIEKLKLQQAQIEAENKDLGEKIAYLDSDHFRERIAKDKLNLKKEGEYVVEILPTANMDENNDKLIESNADEGYKNDELKNYEKWWKLFFSY